jgi:citrate lyase subunit beta/citryl-CoA lyase
MRSLLFVPGDRPERFEKAATSGADIFIVDLEDSVSIQNKPKARDALAGDAVPRNAPAAMFVRINPIDSGHLADDLEALRAAKPDGVMLPKCEGAETVTMLSQKLAALGLGALPILPIATETPAAVFKLGTYSEVSALICGLTWGAEDLPAAIGATASREADGRYTTPYEVVRSLTLFGAHAAHVPAIETVYPDFRDESGFHACASRGRRDGFSGMMAIHPSQVPIINQAFTPDEAEVARAKQVVEAFQANPGAGVIEIGGRMFDLPHLKSARNILSMAGLID